MDVLDVGGGFATSESPDGELDFAGHGIASGLREALDEHFPPGCGVRIIAEPGRFFAERPFCVACEIFGVKRGDVTRYYQTDGVYGGFNCIQNDLAKPVAVALRVESVGNGGDGVPCTVFGPTCDSHDVVSREAVLPADLENGDWLVWPRFGAYTRCAGANFNGIDSANARIWYTWTE